MPALHARSEADTVAIAAAFAPLLRPGDTVLLEGGLGAGKTSFARGLLRTLAGDPALAVPSPTFALVQPYEAAGTPVLHIDLYRLDKPGEAAELGLEDDTAIRLVEWPDRLPDLAATADWRVALTPGGTPDARRIDIAAPDDLARGVEADRALAKWRR